jgi:hypothetical protein
MAVLPQDQYLKPFSIEDTSSALLRSAKISDEVPALFIDLRDRRINDSSIIHQAQLRDYSIHGHFFSETAHKFGDVPVSKADTSTLLYFTLVIFPCIVALWILKSSYSRVQGAFKAAFTNRHSSIFMRTYSLSNHFSTYLIYFNSLWLLSLLAWLFARNNLDEWQNNGFQLFCVIFGALTGYFIYRYFIIRFVGALFQNRENSDQYLYRDYYFKAVNAIVLSPVLIAAAYGPLSVIAWNTAVVITVLLFIYQTFQSFYFGISERAYGPFYFILYFCTVEIAPVIIVLKLISERIFEQ